MTTTSAAEPLWPDERIAEWLDDYWLGVGAAEAMGTEMRDEYEIVLAVAKAEWQRQIVELQSRLDAARAGSWQPLVTSDSNQPIIVMCPVGGELRCYLDGEIACYEGAKMWGFQLPPGVRLWHDTSMELANADRMIAAREKNHGNG